MTLDRKKLKVASADHPIYKQNKAQVYPVTSNRILELYASRHGTTNKGYEILKRSMGLELSGANRKKPSDFFSFNKKKEKKNENI